MVLVRMRLLFTGRVQGVNFRQFVRNRSIALGIGGFVRNLQDGTVEAEWEGEPRAIEELERALREEHPIARIDRVEREEIPVRGDAPPVRIR
ncbi:MAG: acylphosphatase [Thermoplasmata archaeon]|nr:acylphosphatase [Thermoplasmata archaeon]